MKWLSTLCKNCIAKLWMVGIFAIVLVALIVSSIRGALPYLNEYQPQVSQYLFEQYNINLTMKSVKGFWHDGGPLLIIDDINFNNEDSLGIKVQAKQAKLHIDLIETALAFELRFKNIEIESPVIELGDFSHLMTSLSDEDIVLTPWFELVKNALIANLSIGFTHHYGSLPDINIARVSWQSDINERQLLLLLENTPHQEPLFLVLNLSGNTVNTLHGKAYAKANQWEWLNYLKPMFPQINNDVQAVTSFELWADFSARQLDSMMLDIEDNNLQWLDNEKIQYLTITPELIQWLPTKDGWSFETRALQAYLNKTKLTPIDIDINQNNQSLNANISSLNLNELIPLKSLFSLIDDETSTLLDRLNIKGSINDLSAEYKNKQLSYHGSLNDFSLTHAGSIPSVDKLNGYFSGVDAVGEVKFSVTEQIFDFGKYFKAPIAVHKFTSVINWDIGSQSTIIRSPSTQFVNQDIQSNIAWQLDVAAGYSPYFSLLGEAQIPNVKRTEYYLPRVVLSDGLVNYLSSAINAGHSKDIALLWHGALDQFPYNNHDGAFEITARVDNAQFKFANDWKPLTKASVDLHFKNESMVITSTKGQLDELIFESLVARIDNLKVNPSLSIDAIVNQPQSAINEFVFSSPINDILAPVLNQLDISGKVKTLLNIQLPFDESPPTVSGVVKLKNNDVAINAIGLDVEKLNGDVVFNESHIKTENMIGILYEQPIALNLQGKPIDDVYNIAIDVDAKWHTNKMPTLWQKKLNAYISGSLDWQGKLTLDISDEDVTYQSTIQSSMEGLALQFPKPLDKYVDKEEQLYISSNGNLEGGVINVAIGSSVEARANIDTKNSELTIPALTLLIGRHFQPQDEFATAGMMINLDLEYLAIEEWSDFIRNIEKSQSTETFFPPLHRVNASVYQVNLYDYELDIVDIRSYKKDGYWDINFDSSQAKGALRLFDDLLNKGFKVDFERLNIARPEATEDSNKLTKLDQFATRNLLRNLPPLSFNCNVCQLLGINLGQVSFVTKPHLEGLSINDILVNTQGTTLDADVIWGFDEKGEYTSLSGKLNSENIESTLGLFDYSSSIRDSDLDSQFDLMWRDSLYNPSLTTLSGQAHWELGEGHIAEVSDQGARIFSLFSLDSLRRKLVLDFRDVFQKGIFFNDFKGDFTIDNGIAVTENAYMDGVAGSVDVVGSINLSTQELDYYISFSPRLFSNLPVLAGVMASQPQVFVLTFAITKVLEPIVDVISQVNFKLSGNVDNPNFEEIDRQQKKYKVPPNILEKAGVSVPSAENQVEQLAQPNPDIVDEPIELPINKAKTEVKKS